MIEFSCFKCSKKFKVPDEHAGKKAKCPKCQAVLIVPEKQPLPIQPTISSKPFGTFASNSDKDAGRSNILFLSVLGVILFCVLIAVVYFVFWRDNWESDNYQRIVEFIDKSESEAQSKHFEVAIRNYDKLFDFVGNRQLKKDYVRNRLDEAQRSYQEIWQSFEPVLSSELLTFERQAEGSIGTRNYEDAIAKCTHAVKRAEEFPYLRNEIAKHLTGIQQLLETAKNGIAQEKLQQQQLIEQKQREQVQREAEKKQAEEEQAKRVALYRENPYESFRIFVQNLVDQVNKSGQVQFNPDNKYWRTGLLRIESGAYTINVERTNSLASPYIGILKCFINATIDGNQDNKPNQICFAAQDGGWVLKSGQSLRDRLHGSEWWNWPDWYYEVFKKALETVPNP